MAKSRGGFSTRGADEMAEGISNFAELLKSNEQKSIGGLSGAVASTFSLGAKISEAILKMEYKRVKKYADAEGKEQLRQAVIADARAKALKTLDKESREKLKKSQIELKEAQKRADAQDAENKRAVEISKAELNVAKQNLDNAKRNGENIAKFEEEYKKAQQKHQEAQKKQDSDAKLNKVSLAVRQREIAEITNLANKQMLEELQRKGMADGITLADLYEDGELDLTNAEHQEHLARLESQIGFKSSSRGGLGLDSLYDDDTTAGTIIASDKKKSSTQSKSEANKVENIRAEAIAHRDARDKLLDNYHDLSLDELASISGDVLAIRKVMDDIHERIKDGKLLGEGQDDGGFGLGDMFSSLFGKGKGLVKGAGSLLSKGAGVVSKFALPAMLAYGGYKGISSAFDADAIAQRKGVDPSEVGVLDRIQYGASGLLSGLTGGIIGTDTIANAGEAVGNFLFGKSDASIVSEERAKEQQAQAELDALLASRGIIQTTNGGNAIKDNSIHSQILEQLGVEVPNQQPQGQELAELNEGMGGVLSSSSSSVVNNTTTNVIPESPRFRINDLATQALATQGI